MFWFEINVAEIKFWYDQQIQMLDDLLNVKLVSKICIPGKIPAEKDTSP